MSATAFVRARVEEDLRDDAADVLKTLGLTISDVIRMTLTRVATEKSLPFELTKPNAVTLAALEEAQEIRQARKQRFATAQDLLDDIEKKAR